MKVVRSKDVVKSSIVTKQKDVKDDIKRSTSEGSIKCRAIGQDMGGHSRTRHKPQ